MKLDKIRQIAESEEVKTGINFRELINKELMLGQSRHVCRYGTLSDGHDKITDSQRYYQSIKEMYGISNEMNLNLGRAMEAQADALEAQDALKKAPTEWEILRAKAKKLNAETRLDNLYVTLQDQSRMLDEYNKVRIELQSQVQAKYPEGIEQAEQDNWQAIGEYWAFKKQVGANPNPLTHLPLDAKSKARLGVETKNPELVGWFLSQNSEEIKTKYKGNVDQYLVDKLNLDPRQLEHKGNKK